MVKTKIICTIGPASGSYTVLRKMMVSGMDVARLNFSHGTHREHKKRIACIRSLNKRYRRHIRILQDLEGHRVRIGKLKGKKVQLKKRQKILLSNLINVGDEKLIPFDYEGSLSDIKKGAHFYIDDGRILLIIQERLKRYLKAEVVIPGVVTERKGINMPDVELRFQGLTSKDKNDLAFGVESKVDFVAQSFVRNSTDVCIVKDAVGDKQLRVIAKIENRDGIKNIDSIIDVSDGIMIARGDMGVSMPIFMIPAIQKTIIRKCLKKKKMVITATQMLESMTERLIPTRAEVTDVANAILDGSGYLMLSAETATGRYPVETVKMMNSIIRYTEYFRDTAGEEILP